MEIKFQTKDQSNREQEEAFLRLSGENRVLQFFKLSAYFCQFPQNKKREENSKNFVIEKNNHA